MGIPGIQSAGIVSSDGRRQRAPIENWAYVSEGLEQHWTELEPKTLPVSASEPRMTLRLTIIVLRSTRTVVPERAGVLQEELPAVVAP